MSPRNDVANSSVAQLTFRGEGEDGEDGDSEEGDMDRQVVQGGRGSQVRSTRACSKRLSAGLRSSPESCSVFARSWRPSTPA